MISLLQTVALFAAMTSFYLLGGHQLAVFAKTLDVRALGVSVAAYIIANMMFVVELRSGEYGPAMIVSAMALLVGHMIIGATLMEERYSSIQIIGAALAVLAMALVNVSDLRGQG
ncbi:MAG: hypothetical protein AAGI89_02045 [Pseudomonadota bacterium]